MRIKNIAIILTLLLFIVLIPFIWPATNIRVFGQHIDWNGLNLATITGDRYEGELRFRDALDTRGGTKYTFQADLSTFSEDERNQKADEIVTKYADRLERSGYKDFDMKWWIKDENIHITVLVANQNADDSIIIPLLGSRGNFSFWTQDPEFDPNAEENKDQEFSFYQGMQPASITQDDIISLDSVYGARNNGYGFKIKFRNEAAFNILSFSQSETYRTTMMVIDGQPIAVRSYQLDTPTSLNDYEPVIFMSSLIDNSFDINDTIEVVWKTGELPTNLEMTDTQTVSPLLGESFEWDAKLAIFIAVGLLSVLLVFRYKFLGVFVVTTYTIFGILIIFILMLLKAQLSLPLILGTLLGFLLLLLLQIDFLGRVKKHSKSNIREVYEDVKAIQPHYRKLLLVLLGLSLLVSYIPIFEVSQTATALGVSSILIIAVLYLTYYLYLTPFYNLQLRYETNKKS